MNEKQMVIKCLEQFDTKQEKVSQTLFNVYPDEMNAIVRLVKKCNLAYVTNRRELLIDFLSWYTTHDKDKEEYVKTWVNNYLGEKSINGG